MPIQGCGVASSRRLFGGVRFLTKLGVGVGFFVQFRLRKSTLDHFYITLLSWEFLLNWYDSL